jgi:DNA mismatch repair ATPase MutS
MHSLRQNTTDKRATRKTPDLSRIVTHWRSHELNIPDLMKRRKPLSTMPTIEPNVSI